VVSQRLVRRLCQNCRQAGTPTRAERAWLQTLKLRPPTRACGCPACQRTGYHGRIGAFEVWQKDASDYDLLLSGVDEQTLAPLIHLGVTSPYSIIGGSIGARRILRALDPGTARLGVEGVRESAGNGAQRVILRPARPLPQLPRIHAFRIVAEQRRFPIVEYGDVTPKALAALEAVHGGAFQFAFGVSGAGVLAFVVFDFALADADGDLDLVVFPIEGEGDEGAALGGTGLGEFAEFAFVKEEFAGRSWGVVIEIAVGILLDVGVVKPEFAILDSGEGIPDLAKPGAQRLHFGAAQGDTGLVGGEDEVFVPGLGVGKDVGQ
jgi:hypothetical protein